MIYFEEERFERHIDLLDHFCSQEECDLIIWFFPGSKERSICDLRLAPKGLTEGERVTEYANGYQPKKTRRVKLTKELIEKIRNSANTLTENCDSMILYKPDEQKWMVCSIEHERKCLINDDSYLDGLVSAGFSVTTKKPDGW